MDPEDVNGDGSISYPATLQFAPVVIDSDSACSSVFNGTQEPAARPDLMLCAGGDGRHDACVGDSGGPLLVPDGAAGWTQIGVVSWGAGCAVHGVPGRLHAAVQPGDQLLRAGDDRALRRATTRQRARPQRGPVRACRAHAGSVAVGHGDLGCLREYA